jgi:hypothetical protein
LKQSVHTYYTHSQWFPLDFHDYDAGGALLVILVVGFLVPFNPSHTHYHTSPCLGNGFCKSAPFSCPKNKKRELKNNRAQQQAPNCITPEVKIQAICTTVYLSEQGNNLASHTRTGRRARAPAAIRTAPGTHDVSQPHHVLLTNIEEDRSILFIDNLVTFILRLIINPIVPQQLIASAT